MSYFCHLFDFGRVPISQLENMKHSFLTMDSYIGLLLPSLFITLSLNFVITRASTYDLKYDGIVSTTLLSLGINENISEIPPEIAKTLSQDIGNEAFLLWKAQDEAVERFELNENCHVQETFGSAPHGTCCDIHHASKNFSMDISLKLSCIIDSNGDTFTTSFDGKDSFVIGAKIDISLNAPRTKGRDILTALVPKINELIQQGDLTDNSLPTWNIQARPSHYELLEMHDKLNEREVSNDISYLDATTQSSLESTILSNNMLMEKKLLHKTIVSNYKEYNVWQHSQPGSIERTTTSLFVFSKLRHTTTFAGVAHAEAMIHPALISHPNPSHIAVFSDFPSAYLREILKHKNVETVDVYTNLEVVFITEKFFPELNNCKEFDNRAAKCFDSPGVSLLEWENFESVDQNYDAVFLDFSDPDSWSNDEMTEVFEVIDHDGIMVLNAGSMPSMDTIIHEEISKLDYRTNFVRKVTRPISKGGFGEGMVHVYDEVSNRSLNFLCYNLFNILLIIKAFKMIYPAFKKTVQPKAQPLDSTFIIVTGGDATESEVYRRFVRRNPVAFDLDMANQMSQSLSSYVITKLYDGATHLSYIRPSRVWENWTCQKKPWKYMDHCARLLKRIYNPKYHVNEVDIILDPIKGRTTKALEDIPKGNVVLPHDGLVSMFFDDETYKHFKNFVQKVPSAVLYKQVLDIIDGYGFEVSTHGFTGYVCSIANNTFMNHACSAEDLNAGPMLSTQLSEDTQDVGFFNPVSTRRAEFYGVHTVTLRDIKKGEELLMDYTLLRNSGVLRDSELGICEGNGIIPMDQEKDPNVGHHRLLSDEE